MGREEIWVFSSPGPPSFIATSLLELISLLDGHSRQVAPLQFQISLGSRNTTSSSSPHSPTSIERRLSERRGENVTGVGNHSTASRKLELHQRLLLCPW